MPAPTTLVVLTSLTPDLGDQHSLETARRKVQIEFPWALDVAWNVEFWGVRPWRAGRAVHDRFRCRGPRLPLERAPILAQWAVAWCVHALLFIVHRPKGILTASIATIAPGAVAARLLARSRTPLVTVVKSYQPSRSRHMRGSSWRASLIDALYRFVLRRSQIVVVRGSFTEDVARRSGVPADRIVHLIAHGSIPDDYEPTDVVPLRRNPLRLVCAARLVPEKGVDVLLEAFALMDRDGVVLEIAGDGAERADLEALAQRLGIADRVEFKGLITSRMLDFYQGALAVVLPSRADEGLGMALVEGALNGCALVGSDVGGITDTIVDGETGVLVPPNDATALAEVLRNLVDDPQRALTLGDAARRQSTERVVGRKAALAELRRRMEELTVPV